MTHPVAPTTLRHLAYLGMVVGMVVSLVMVFFACATPSVSEHTGSTLGLVVTQVPVDGPVASVAVDPAARYPTGSRIIFVPSIDRRDDYPDDYQVLSKTLSAAGSPDLSPDAESIVFTGRESDADPWSIYEARIWSGKLKKIVEIDGNCIDPAYLAGSRIVFSCKPTRSAASGSKASLDWSLYAADVDGKNVERISFGPGAAFGATALLDGRVLFSMRQRSGLGRPDEGAIALFTSNSDGTLLEAFTGSHSQPALKLRPRQGDGKVLFIGKPTGSGAAQIEQVDMGRPISSRIPIPFPFTPFSVEPLGNSTLLIASPGYRDGSSQQASGVFRWILDESDPRLVFHQAGWREIGALSARPTPTPKNLPSSIDPTSQDGVLVCYDASRSEITDHSSSSSPRPATGVPSTGVLKTVVLSTLTADNKSRPEVELGRSIVESDGSFSLTVPADIPLRVTTLTPEGTELESSDWFWIRPGEVRACFGCHESREKAPVNRPIQALSHPTRTLVAPDGVAPDEVSPGEVPLDEVPGR